MKILREVLWPLVAVFAAFVVGGIIVLPPTTNAAKTATSGQSTSRRIFISLFIYRGFQLPRPEQYLID